MREAPSRPDLPEDEEVVLPHGVRRDIDRLLGRGRKADDVALALSIGSAAIEDDRPDVAVEHLAWARHEAPRLVVLREAYGVALYLVERYAEALSELQAYRRMSGRTDQNHLVADCLRALGRPIDQVVGAAQELVEDDDAPEDRRAEATIVWASATADGGALGPARAIVRRYLDRRPGSTEEWDLRVRYVAADLAQRGGLTDEAVGHLHVVLAADPDFLDVAERLTELRADR